MIPTSPSNPKIKLARKLRDRKERQQSGLFYIEGLRIVGEAADTGADFEYVLVAPELLQSEFGQSLVERLGRQGATLLEVGASTFKGFAHKDNPQGIAAVLRQRWTPIETIDPQPGASWVALDAVQDPGNLGTIMRTHDAVGGAGLIILDNSTDPYDVTAVRASMGAVFSQRLVKCPFEAFARWKIKHGTAVIGTSGAATSDYQALRYPDPCILLMGSEKQGLLQHHLDLCDHLVSIPMAGRSDSLNLAVATAVVLYEIFNQRRSASPNLAPLL